MPTMARRHITVNKPLSASLNKTFPSFLPAHHETKDRLTSLGSRGRGGAIVVLKRVEKNEWIKLKSQKVLIYLLRPKVFLFFFKCEQFRRAAKIRKEGNVLFNNALNTF